MKVQVHPTLVCGRLALQQFAVHILLVLLGSTVGTKAEAEYVGSCRLNPIKGLSFHLEWRANLWGRYWGTVTDCGRRQIAKRRENSQRVIDFMD